MNIGIIILISVGVIWALGILLGVVGIGGLSKTFSSPTPTSINSTLVKSQQQQSIEDTEEKRQKLMDDMQQKMEDARQRY